MQGPLDPAFTARRERLKAEAPDFGTWVYQGPREARWPVRPGKYLVVDYGVGFHAETTYMLADDLDAVRSLIAEDEANVGHVVDLDTGDEVGFTRSVSVELEEPAP